MITIEVLKKIDAFRGALCCCPKGTDYLCPLDRFAPAKLVQLAHANACVDFFEKTLHDAQTGIACEDTCPCIDPLIDLMNLSVDPKGGCHAVAQMRRLAANDR